MIYKSKREKQKGLTCTVEGCTNWRRSKGYCDKHYMAFVRYGDVMGGKTGKRTAICKLCGQSFPLIKADQGYCAQECYRKSIAGKAAAYRANKQYWKTKTNREKAQI